MVRRLLTVALLSACSANWPKGADMVQSPPSVLAVPAATTADDVWSAAIRVLATRGFLLQDQEHDRGAGVITTTWTDVESAVTKTGDANRGTLDIKTAKRRHALRVVVADGQLTVVIQCSQLPEGQMVWRPCDDEQRNVSYENQVRGLAAEILDEAERAAARRAGR
jgi:uncharacterized lipoprotein